MIAKITRGSSTVGLVHYLLGPTKDPANVHHDQRVIAASAGLDYSRESAHAAGMSQERFIALQMDCARLDSGIEVKGGHVWHLSLTNPAGDRELGDDQWSTIARHAMEALGFDDGRGPACPWAAIRHGESEAGNEHVHIAVSLVRDDFTVASVWNDRVKISRVCAEMEQTYGLKVVEGRHAGAVPEPTRPEIEIAERQGLQEVPRVRLERLVRAAAVASADEAEFVRRLRSQGVSVRPRYAEAGTDRVTGYSVAEPRPAGGGEGFQPRWWGGGTLAKDLRLTALRSQWQPIEDQGAAWGPNPGTSGREAAKLSGAAMDRALDEVRAAVRHAQSADPARPEMWAPLARDLAGVAGQLATKDRVWRQLERDLARTAQLAAGGKRTPVAAVGTVLAATGGAGSNGGAGWVALAGELLRLTQAIHALHVARQELLRAQALKSAVAEPRAALAVAARARPTNTIQTAIGGPVAPPQPEKGFER